MAHNLFHANYGDYKKSSPDTAVLLLLSKVTKALSTAVPSIKSTLAPCRGLFLPLVGSLLRYLYG